MKLLFFGDEKEVDIYSKGYCSNATKRDKLGTIKHKANKSYQITIQGCVGVEDLEQIKDKLKELDKFRRWGVNKYKPPKPKKEFDCEICGNHFLSSHIGAKYCKQECRNKASNLAYHQKKALKEEFLYDEM